MEAAQHSYIVHEIALRLRPLQRVVRQQEDPDRSGTSLSMLCTSMEQLTTYRSCLPSVSRILEITAVSWLT